MHSSTSDMMHSVAWCTAAWRPAAHASAALVTLQRQVLPQWPTPHPHPTHLSAWSRYCRRSGPMSMLSVSNTDRLRLNGGGMNYSERDMRGVTKVLLPVCSAACRQQSC